MTVDELQVLITANTNELRKEINNANKSISGLKKSAEKGAGGVSGVFKKLKTAIITLGIGKVIKDSIQSGMDAVESESLFETVFKNNADSVRSWSEELSNALGLNAYAVRNNAGVIYSMTSSMGIAEENAIKMSKGIATLTEDLASFRNLTSEEAFAKLKAGITGEAEPLKAIGILVDENTVKQTAYSEGIAENGAELTQQQKVLARYVAILKQTGDAQGDLARTINSPSNQLRQLKSQVQNLSISLSKFFMPVVQAVLPWVTAFTKVVTQAVTSLATFFGLTGNDDLSEETKKANTNVGGMSDGLDDANKKAKKLKKSLAGFDEMNVLQDNSSNSGDESSDGGATGVDIGFNLDEYDAHLDWIDGSTKELTEKIKGYFLAIGEGIDFSKLITSFNNLKKSVEPLAKNIWDGLKWAFEKVLTPLAQWTINDVIPKFMDIFSGGIDIVNQAIEDAKPVLSWFWDNVLSPIADWTGGVITSVLGGIADALKWIAGNEIAMSVLEGIAIAIGLVSTALGIYNTVTTVTAIVTKALSVGLAAINWPLVLITAAIAAVIAVVIICIKYWDEIKAVAIKCWDGIKNVWNTVAEWFSTYVIDPIKNFFTGLWDGIKNIFTTVVNWIKENWQALLLILVNPFAGAFKLIYDNCEGFRTIVDNVVKAIKEFFSGLWTKIKEIFSTVGTWFKDTFNSAVTSIKNVFSSIGSFFSGIWTTIKNVFSSVGSWFSGIFSKAWDGIKSAFSKVKSFFTDIWDTIKGIFSKVGSVIADAISGAVKNAVNTVLSLAIKIINGFISAINLAIGVINLIPGVDIKKLDKMEVPKLAQGGIIDKPTIAMVGEAGKEAVMPLERNTGWIDQLASKLGDKIGGGAGNIKLIVKLGEEAIFDRFIEYGKEKAFETNGEVVFI